MDGLVIALFENDPVETIYKHYLLAITFRYHLSTAGDMHLYTHTQATLGIANWQYGNFRPV